MSYVRNPSCPLYTGHNASHSFNNHTFPTTYSHLSMEPVVPNILEAWDHYVDTMEAAGKEIDYNVPATPVSTPVSAPMTTPVRPTSGPASTAACPRQEDEQAEGKKRKKAATAALVAVKSSKRRLVYPKMDIPEEKPKPSAPVIDYDNILIITVPDAMVFSVDTDSLPALDCTANYAEVLRSLNAISSSMNNLSVAMTRQISGYTAAAEASRLLRMYNEPTVIRFFKALGLSCTSSAQYRFLYDSHRSNKVVLTKLVVDLEVNSRIRRR